MYAEDHSSAERLRFCRVYAYIVHDSFCPRALHQPSPHIRIGAIFSTSNNHRRPRNAAIRTDSIAFPNCLLGKSRQAVPDQTNRKGHPPGCPFPHKRRSGALPRSTISRATVAVVCQSIQECDVPNPIFVISMVLGIGEEEPPVFRPTHRTETE